MSTTPDVEPTVSRPLSDFLSRRDLHSVKALADVHALKTTAFNVFGDALSEQETAISNRSLKAGAALAPWYNKRGTEFVTLERGDVTVNGSPLLPGQIVRIDPGEIVEASSAAGGEILSLIYPYRSVLAGNAIDRSTRHAGPQVSIVIIAQNIENHISQCLSSCIRQTHHNLQIVVMVDPSRDATAAKCRRMARFDPRIEVHETATALGANGARRRGLQLTKGEFCMLIDGDDWLNEDAVEQLLDVAKSQASDCISFGFDHHSDVSRAMWDQVLPVQDFVTAGPLYEAQTPDTALQISKLNHTVWMYFFSSRLKDAAAAALLDIPLYEDLPYFLALLGNAQQPAVCNRILYHYRRDRMGQVTQNWGDVKIGVKIACLEKAVDHSLLTLPSNGTFFQLVLLYKTERILIHEMNVAKERRDVTAFTALERCWFSLVQRFSPQLKPSIKIKRTRRKFAWARSPIIGPLYFHARVDAMAKKTRK